MENVVFKDHWESFFASHHLNCFDDFFDYSQGNLVNQNTKRNVMVMKLSDGEQTKTFFMKRFDEPHFKDMLFTLSNFGKICSQGELEWRNANILLDNGIETYHPVCYGFRSICGIERQSFFITEEINGLCLLDYLIKDWGNLISSQRESLVSKLGLFFRKIHDARLSLPDSYIWHIYMVQTGPTADDYEFGMIDLHRMQIRVRGNRPATMNLGRFLFSLPEGFMDERLLTVFMDTYFAADFPGNQNTFIKDVTKWQKKITARRRKTVTSLTS